ncbi:hypothetical protein [Salinisphaera hydrothermalis]|uniref:Uncharacterized protein n=1 Tax=Salinisphaera hydrothermalis (strain C41B8) TaxID=1304275 RepID=A0A084INB0_SALHC|nr:hypothetical protein [Salinisphaera hydrothermalis]KEZ78194.1 hypothetical protein C41B8_06402 [Salinisphaera hydrothermalis C41B8]
MSSNKSAPPYPERTGAVFCVRATCRDLQQMPVEDGISLGRLRTDGGVFFFNRAQFDEAALAQGLKHDESVVIGAHRLHDGSAWLHWLVRDNGKAWAPQSGQRRWLAPLVLLLCPVPIVAALMLPFGVNLFVVLFQIVLFSVGGFAGAWAIYRLALMAHPGRRRLARLFHAARAGEPIATHQPPAHRTPQRLQLDDGLHRDFGLLQGRLDHVSVKQETYGSGRYSYQMLEYHLSCGGAPFSIHSRTGAGEWRTLLDPVLIRRAPLFLAAGDHVSLLTLAADGEIHGLLNESDGIAHVTYKGTLHTPLARRAIQLFVLFILVFMTGVGFTLSAIDWISRGVGPDYWDWMELMHLSLAMLLIMTLLFCGLGLIGERIHHFYFRRKQARPIEKILGIAFGWRLRAGRSATLNEYS